MLATPDGANLLVAYKRAVNILRIENRKDEPHYGPVGRGSNQGNIQNEKSLYY
jgi:hypothetical protein